MKLIRVRNIQSCFSDAAGHTDADVNPKAIAWVDFLGTMFGQGPFFRIQFIGNSSVTVDADDHAKIMEAIE